MEISFELNLEVNSLEQTGMQDGLGASGPPGLIYSSESAPVMGRGESRAPCCQPTGLWPSCTTSTPRRCHSYRGRGAKSNRAHCCGGSISHHLQQGGVSHEWVLWWANKDDGGGE